MTVVPLNDKIVVKRLEAEDEDGRRHRAAGLGQGEAQAGQGAEPRRRQASRQRQTRLLPGQGRRSRPVHLLRRQRSDHRWRRIPHHDRGRHSRRGRVRVRIPTEDSRLTDLRSSLKAALASGLVPSLSSGLVYNHAAMHGFPTLARARHAASVADA